MTTDATGLRTATVRDVTHELLRAHGLTTIFGNVRSTEQPFLAQLFLHEPYLTNVGATTLPRPWVKWAYEPVKDVPTVLEAPISRQIPALLG
jgi:hypothetical protein